MPSPVTRDRRQFKPASQPAPVEDDQPVAVAPPPEEAAPAPPAQAAPPTGTTGGLIPQQAGTWDKPRTQPTSADPAERATQSLQREQEQFAAGQREKNPFIFDNAIPDLSKVTSQRHKERVVAAGDRDYREQQMAERAAAVEQRRAAVGQQKAKNAKLEEQYRSTGQQFYTDPYGDLKPIIEASSGKPLFHATTWEEGVHPKTGLPTLQKRDQYGQRQFKTPPLVASPDLTDDQLYYKFGDNDLRPAGKIEELVNNPNFDVARLAKRTASARKRAMWKEATEPLEQVAAQATVNHDMGQQQAMNIQDQISQLNDQSSGIDPAVLEEKEGGIMGFGAKPTQRALKAQQQKATIDAQIEKLTGDVTKLNEDLKPGGTLGRAKRQANLDVAIFKAKGMHDNYADLADERRLILRQQGKSEADDATLKSILAAQQEYGTQLERGITASQREDVAHAPAAQAEPTHREAASSPTPPPDAPKDIKKQWGSATPLERLKMMIGVQRGNTEVEEAPPAIGSEAAGTKGSAFTVPKMDGEGVLPGVINAANKFTSGMTTPENAALMVGSGAAGFVAKIAQGTKLALAAHAAETGVSAAFTAQMAKDTLKAGKEAYKVVNDPKSTDKEKADAITSAILTGGMTAFAAKGAVEGGKATVDTAKKASREKKTAKTEEPSAAAKAAEAKRAKPKPAEPVEEAPPPAEKPAAKRESKIPSTAEEAANVIEPALKEKANTPPPAKSAAESADVFKADETSTADQKQADSRKEARIQQLVDQLSKGDDGKRAAILGRRKGLDTDKFLTVLEGAADQRRGKINPSEVAADVAREAKAAANKPVGGETPGIENTGRIVPAELEKTAEIVDNQKGEKAAAGQAGVTPEELDARRKAQAIVGPGSEPLRIDQPEEAPDVAAAERVESGLRNKSNQDRAAAIEKQLTEADRLRQSPAGGEKLREQLSGADNPPEEPPAAEPVAKKPVPTKPAPESAAGPRDETVSTGDGVPTEKEKTMLAEQKRLVDEHLAKQKTTEGARQPGKVNEKELTDLQSTLSKKYSVHLSMEPVEGRPDQFSVSTLEVPPLKRGKGIGTKVMEEVRKYADDNGLKISLTAAGDSKTQARRESFWKKQGFEQFSKDPLTGSPMMGRRPGAKALPEPSQTLAREPSSWIIRDKATGKAVKETFDKAEADGVDKNKYDAVPARQHLEELNQDTPARAAAIAEASPRSVAAIKKAPAPVSAHIEEHTPETVTGDKLNSKWTAFDKESGTLGIPREEMPQIKSEHRGALVQFLKARGIEARAGMIDPKKLKPTQAEFSPEKVQKAREHAGSERPLLISADNHVIDGHHQWVAALDDQSGTPMPVIKLNAPVDRILADVKEFPSAEASTGAAKPAPKKAEPVPEAAPRLSDRAIEALKKARISKPGEVYAHTPFTLAWDGAIDTAILAIRAGRAVGDAVKLAVDRFKDKFPDHTDDDLSSLEQAIRDSHSSSPTAKPELAGIRAQVSNYLKKGEIEKAMTYTRDAVDNISSVFGREESNAIKNDLSRAFEGKLAESSDALAFAVESGGDRTKLAEMRAKLEASQKADPKWKERALAAIDFADKNLDALKPIVDRYNNTTSDQVVRENFAGIDTLKRDNYVMHKQDIDESLGHFFLGAAGEGNSSFRKNRKHETFADSIAAGVDPKSLNATDLLQSRVTSGQQMVNKKAWVESLKQFKDPVSKQPVAVDVTYTNRPDGSRYADAPHGYSVERVGNAEIAVMKGYEGIFSALTDSSWWNKSPIRRNLQRANAVGKSLNLLFDTFHLGRLAAWNAATRLNALGALGGGIETPNPFSHKEGVLTLDQTPAELLKLAQEEGRSPEQIKQLLENKQKLNMALETGANFGKISDALHEDVMHNIPGIGHFSKWLFDKYQRGAMSEIWLMEYDRQRAMSGNKGLGDQQVARKVSEEVNTRFGNLGRQGIFKSKTGQDIARLVMLAPQWNEGLVRSEIGGAAGAMKSAVNAATGKGLATSMLTRSLATMVIGQFVANQLINQYTRGKYTWENPEEGMGAKLSAWIPDKIGSGPGFFLHPAGIGAEITHLLTSKYEKTSDFRNSLGALARSRLSAIARPLATYILKTDALGRSLRPDQLYKEVAKDAVPLPIPTSSVTGAVKSLATGDRSEQFPGQFQKQLMATGGLKTDQAPTPGSRIGALASEFNKSKGIQPSGEFYAGDYNDLATALRVGNKANAESTLKDLLAKHTAADIAKHFARQTGAPFTGNTKREPEFIKTLTQEQKDTYREARRERLKLRELANTALRSYMTKNKVEGMAEALQAMMASPSNR